MKFPLFPILFALVLVFTHGIPVRGQNPRQAPMAVVEKKQVYGNDSVACKRNLELLREFFSRKLFDSAAIPWRQCFQDCPAASQEMYIEGGAIYDYFWNRESDPEKRAALLDTLMLIYDARIKHFGKEGYVLARKGVELFQKDPSRAEEALAILERSILIEWRWTRPAVLMNYYLAGFHLLSEGKIDTFNLYTIYDKAKTICDANVMSRKEESALYAAARDSLVAHYESYSPCNALEERYIPAFQNDSSNLALLHEITDAFEERQCGRSRFYLYVVIKIMKLDSNQVNAMHVARAFLKVDQGSFASRFLNVAAKGEDKKIAMEALLLLGEVSFKQLDVPPTTSRDYLERAMDLDSLSPFSYILMAELYAKTSMECGITDFERGVFFWGAVDLLEKARKLDPSLGESLDKEIARYSRRWPTAAMLKENGLREGDTYEMPCWVRQPTIVRAAPSQ